MTITSKSDYVLEIRFGKISYESSKVSCDMTDLPTNNIEPNDSDAYISREYVYVDTNYGVKCPLKAGIYEKLNSKHQQQQKHHTKHASSSEYALPIVIAPSYPSTTTPTSSLSSSNEPCKYLTQTQTLQVGCHSEQQYSLRTRLCYPNQQASSNNNDETSDDETDTVNPKRRGSSSSGGGQRQSTTAYTQLESEINLVCLADWTHNGNHVIVSRTMSNEILCSV